MHPRRLIAFLCLLAAVPASTRAFAETTGKERTFMADTVYVTSTWVSMSPEQQPESKTVIEGGDLRRRGVTDLRSALLAVAGVEAVPGGDGGPAASVPALWGLREFDAFLLLVDGIPWGGAFVPDLPTLDLHDVDRIEVLRGPAPITYGSTSFVGVIHVFHNGPGSGNRTAEISGGSFGTVRGAFSTDVGTKGRLSLDGAQEKFADDDAGVIRGHGRYRMDLAHGIRVGADASLVNQDPASPHPRAGKVLDPNIPLDSNHNPSDAKLNRYRVQLSASQSNRIVDWAVAASHVHDENVRGFLEPDAADDGSSPNANGYTQERNFNELYAEAHHLFHPVSRVGLVAGADVMFGKGEEESQNFRYYAPFNGKDRRASSTGVPVEDTEFEAERTFLGLFLEADWRPAPRWTFLAGVRLNDVEEKRDGEAENDQGVEVPASISTSKTRPGGRVGVNWMAWQSGEDDISLYIDGRDTFKPAAIDFGPEAEVDPLKPETARSGELGLKTNLLDRRLHVDVSAFQMDFENLVVSTVVNGNPALANAGKERFRGVEIDAECELTPEWRALASYAWHEAKFRDYVQAFDGVPTQLRGKFLEMSPKRLATAGLAYAGPRFHAEAMLNYIGERFLNKRNTAPAESYVTLDASVGVPVGSVDLRVSGRNLTDRRDAVAESELGDAQYYRLPSRAVEAGVVVHL